MRIAQIAPPWFPIPPVGYGGIERVVFDLTESLVAAGHEVIVCVAATPFYPADQKRGYVAFLGRCHWEKGPDGAIRVAQAAGVPLMMALRVTSEERSYFEAVVRPLVLSIKNLAKFVGEVDGREKDDLFGRAGAVLFPSPWEEPFGMVLAEAAARGTPVVALARGAVPELVVDGVTGILCADEEEMARAIPRAMALDPAACRAHAEALFDRDRIAGQNLSIYERVLAEHGCGRGSSRKTRDRD